MKKILTLILLLLCATTTFAQSSNILREMRAKEYATDEIFQSLCTMKEGAIVISSKIPNLQFNITNIPVLNNVTYQASLNRYVITVAAMKEELGAAKVYKLEITAKGYKPLILDVRNVLPAAQGTKAYTVQPVPLGWNETDRVCTYGVIAGLNGSRLKDASQIYDFQESHSNLLFPTIGAFVEFKLSKYISLQPEITFTRMGIKGTQIDDLHFTTDGVVVEAIATNQMNINYLRIPINLSINLVNNQHFGLFVGAGVNISYALSANFAFSGVVNNSNSDLYWDEEVFNLLVEDEYTPECLDPLDLSATAYLGVRYRRYFLRAEMDFMHSEINHWINLNKDYASDIVHSYILQAARVTLGVKF